MRRAVLLCAVGAVLGLAFSAGAADAAKEPWRDPTVTSINRLPARAIAVPCESEKLALAIAKGERPRTDSAYLQSLNGVWDFKWKPNVQDDWAKTNSIAVPGCWQLEGDYDPALYTNLTYPIAGYRTGDPTETPPTNYTAYAQRTPVGLYTRTFTVPSDWANRRITIHFGGVSSAFCLRVNGRDIGYSEDSRLPAEFDITSSLITSSLIPHPSSLNTLEVEVFKHSDGSYLEDQDFWRLSGIFRDVWLVAELPDAAKDLVVETTLADDYSSGTVTVRDENGATLLEKTYDHPKLWSCEEPNLYYETLAFKCPGGWLAGSDYRAVAFGFRKIEIKDAVVYLNGKRLLVKGVNRHEMAPATGYTVSREQMEADISIFKILNVNAVRTCHYPDDPTWYELCDRAGIYVCCEANVEAHGVKDYYGKGEEHLPKNPLYHNAIVERGVNMVKTYRNHPSIVFWSLGNESGWGPAFDDEYAAMRALDATRPIQYEGMQDSAASDIKCPMYARPWDVEAYVTNNPAKPYILCEYVHAMGNSCGGVQEYWDLVRQYPSAQGGYIWDFADQALWKKVKGKGEGEEREVLAYGGEFGDVPNDGHFNCDGLVSADRSYHPGSFEVQHAYQNVSVTAWDWSNKVAHVRNDFRFTGLDGVRGMWKVDRDGQTVATGLLDLSGFPPDSEKDLTLDTPDGDAILFAFGTEGAVQPFAHDQFVKPFVAKPLPEERDGGTPASAASLFRLNFWRAPIDNDRGWKMPERCAVWRTATETQQVPAGCTSDLSAKRLADGKILVDWTLTVATEAKLPPIPRVGLSFAIPTNCTKVTWFGKGPWENYADRDIGAMLGIFGGTVGLNPQFANCGSGESAVRDPDALNPDNYSRPCEQGHRGGCRWVTFSDGADRTVKVTALNAPFGFNAWPYPQEALERARHMYEVERGKAISVTVDAVQMGVGGDNSWGARPHKDAMPGAGTYRLQFLVEGL